MEDSRFLELAKEVLVDIEKDGDFSTIKSKIWPYLATYINNNPNSPSVQWFRYSLLELYTKEFYNQELFNAFALDDSVSYYKQIQIYLNLPYTRHPNWPHYLSDLFEFPPELPYDHYERFRYLLKTYYYPGFAEHTHMQSILNFVKENDTLMHGIKDDYFDLEKEMNYYRMAMRRQNFKDLESFRTINHIGDYDSLIRRYTNRRIGNIGELYVYNDLSKRFFSLFVSRDIKDGFGYDIYYYDNDYHIENLVEVKTTPKAPSDDDYFYTSKNELRVMEESLDNQNARYLIVRVYLDSSLNPSYSTLVLKDKDTLVDMNNNDITYKLHTLKDGSLCFMKHNPQKTIQYHSAS